MMQRRSLPESCRRYCVWGVVLAGVIGVSAGQAATVPIFISGTITSKPQCVVNNNQTIRVEFGDDLVTTKINGSNYLRTIDYTLDCKSNSKNAMKMKVVGAAATFDSSAIQVSAMLLWSGVFGNGFAVENMYFHGALVAEPCVIPPGKEVLQLDYKYLYMSQRTPGMPLVIQLAECDLSLGKTVSLTFSGSESLGLPEDYCWKSSIWYSGRSENAARAAIAVQ